MAKGFPPAATKSSVEVIAASGARPVTSRSSIASRTGNTPADPGSSTNRTVPGAHTSAAASRHTRDTGRHTPAATKSALRQLPLLQTRAGVQVDAGGGQRPEDQGGAGDPGAPWRRQTRW